MFALRSAPTVDHARIPVPVDDDSPGARWLVAVVLLGCFAVLVGDGVWFGYGILAVLLYVLERILTELRRARREAQAGRDWMD